MTNARQRLIQYIEEHSSATVDELSRVFKVTPANIRHHLSILVDQGSLDIIGVKTTGCQGRPVQIYSSTAQTRLTNLENLADILLSDYLDGTMKETERSLRRIAHRMADRYLPDQNNPTRRMYACIRVLNQMNYQAHWEAHVENPRILLDHCPYQKIREKHPEICQMDEYLLEALLGSPVRLVDKLSHNLRDLPQCIFALSRPNL